MIRTFADIVRDSGIAPTPHNLHRIGSEMQGVIDLNIAAAAEAGADPDACWACWDADTGAPLGYLAYQPRGRSPEFLVTFTCPVCKGRCTGDEA